MKTKKIKALILEDSEDDVKLVLRELNKGQYEIEYTLVEDADGFENALKKEWDVIIADYTLPTYTGREALNMCNEKGIEIPFIVVSGSIGEDIAVNMMRKGVKDYIMKNNLTRLLPAIEREIAEAKIRKEKKLWEEKLIVSEIRYRRLFESAKDGILILDFETGMITDVNPFLVELLGYSHETFLGKTIWDIGFFKDIFANEENFLELKQRDYVRYEDLPLETFNKRKIDVEFISNVYQVDHKKVIQCNIRDITERKQAEENTVNSQKLLQRIIDLLPIRIFWKDTDLNYLGCNEIFAKDAGKKSSKDLIGLDDFQMNWKEQAKAYRNDDQKVIKSGESKINYDEQQTTPDGDKIWLKTTKMPLTDLRGNIIGILGSYEDITERKLSEDSLKKSEERFQLAARAANDIIYDWNLVKNEGWFSESYKKLFGYDETKSKFDIWKENIHPEDRDRAISLTNAVLKSGGESWTVEYRLKRNDGSYAHILDRGYVIRDDKGNPIRLIGSIIDFSERKKAEEALSESEEQYRKLYELSPETIYIQTEGNIVFINPAGLKLFKAKNKNEIIGRKILDLIHPEFQDIAKSRMSLIENFLTEVPLMEEKYLCLDGSVIDVEVIATPFLFKGKKSALVLMRDISDRKKSEVALKESEERYRKLFELSPETIFLQYEGKIEFINPAGLKLFKAKNENEIIGRKVIDFIHPDYKEIISQRISFINSNFVDIPINVNKYICLDGSTVDVEVMATAFIYKGKNAALVVSRDITERKKSDEALKASEERYRILIESMHDGVMQVDTNDKIQFANNRICEIFGYSNEEMIGKAGIDLVVFEDDRNIVREKFSQHRNGISIKHVTRGKKKSGEILWLNVSATPVKDEFGVVKSSVIFMSDITDHKRAEDELIKISQAINQSPVTVVITDVKGDIEYVNPKFVETTGYTPEEVIEKNPRILKSDEKSPEEYKELWDTITSGKVWIGEFHNKKKNGELFWENASISPVKNSEGKITHFLAVKEDITEKKQKEIELIKAKEKAEESERLKSNFLANMSHELRTPMVGILGFAELMKDMTDNPELKEFSDYITRSGKRLMETLNLILDLSRIEAGKLEIKSSDVNIVTLTKEVYENYIAEAKKKNLMFSFNSSSEKIISKVDDRMLWEAINNLINNAIKFTKKGEVKVEVKTEKINNEKKAVISVSDTGIGIPKDSINLIFEEFRQVSEGYGRGFQGTGLGLTITKNFVEKTGGIITVKSEVGVGSVFTIELPLLETDTIEIEPEKEKEIELEEIPESEKKNIHLLCVDDDIYTSKYIDFILKNDYILSFAIDGISALELAKSHMFSLILMDINLGKGMDGVETTRKIRKLPGYDKVPVIALTAFAMKGDKEDFLNSGMNDYISKPFKTLELKKVIKDVLIKSNI